MHGLQRVARQVAELRVDQESCQHGDGIASSHDRQQAAGLLPLDQGRAGVQDSKHPGGVGVSEGRHRRAEQEAAAGVRHAVDVGAVLGVRVQTVGIEPDPCLAGPLANLPIVDTRRLRGGDKQLDPGVIGDGREDLLYDQPAALRGLPEGQGEAALGVHPARHNHGERAERLVGGKALAEAGVVVERYGFAPGAGGGQAGQHQEPEHTAENAATHDLLSASLSAGGQIRPS